MPLSSRDLGPELGFDCSVKLSHADCQRLTAAVYQGKPLTFCWRYVFFGPALHGDIDADELRAITGAGMALLIVQHPRLPEHNTLSADTGTSDGDWAVRNAAAAGYVTPAGDEPICLALDLEGVRNPGAAVAAHAVNWCNVVRAGGYRPVIYVGYDAGLTAQELWEIPVVDRYWCAWGPWDVAERGPCCKQFETTTIAGVEVDPDHAFADKKGGVLRGLTWVEAPATADA